MILYFPYLFIYTFRLLAQVERIVKVLISNTTKGATDPLGTTLVFVSMTIPEDSEAEYTGSDLYVGLTCPPAKAGEYGLRISFVVDDEILGNHILQMMSLRVCAEILWSSLSLERFKLLYNIH